MKRLLNVALALGLLVGCGRAVENVEPVKENETHEVVDVNSKEVLKQEYFDTMEIHFNDFENNMNLVFGQFQKAEADPLLWIDSNWRLETMGYFEEVAKINSELREMQDEDLVPEDYKGLHAEIRLALFKYDEAGKILTDFNNVRNNDALYDGGIKMQEAIEEVFSVWETYEKIQK